MGQERLGPSHSFMPLVLGHLDHVTNDYQKLRDKVKRLLKSKMKEFLPGSFQYTQLSNIATTMKTEILKIEGSVDAEERKTSLKKEVYIGL